MTPDQTHPTGDSSSTSSTVREDLLADASRLSDSAKQRAKEEAETRKHQVTQTARSASSALGRAADDLDQDDDAPTWLSSAFREAASGIERLAGTVEERSADGLARDVTRFARENPTAFLAGSAAAGFAAARLLRAGAEYRSEHRDDWQNGAESRSGGVASGGSGSGSSFGQTSAGGFGRTPSPATSQTGTGYGSSAENATSTRSTEPAGYGSNPVQGGGA